MKLLYVLESFQHPTMRGATRHYHFVRKLSQRHAITLLVLCKTHPNAAARDEMSRYVRQLYTFAMTDSPETANGDKKGRFGRLITRLVNAVQMRLATRKMKKTFNTVVRTQTFDLILVHGKNVFPVVKKTVGLPIVSDFCDASSVRLRKSLFHGDVVEFPFRVLQYWKARRIDLALLKKTRHHSFIAPRDLNNMGESDDQFRIIPNGVERQYWTRKGVGCRPNCLVFTGVMDYWPNADAALYLIKKIVPLIRREISDVEVVIAGRNPLPELIKVARKYPGITVTGYVDDIRPYYEQATVYVCPLRFASGMQNKLLEALAMEVPVVTTPVAAAGLYLEDGSKPPLVEADGEEQFAEAVIRLLKERKERAWLTKLGRRFVEKHFDWVRSAQMLEQMCIEATALDSESPNDHREGDHALRTTAVLST